MKRYGDTCAICEQPILARERMVRPAAYPWLLEDIAGVAHRECANALVHDIETVRAEQERDYFDGIRGGLERD